MHQNIDAGINGHFIRAPICNGETRATNGRRAGILHALPEAMLAHCFAFQASREIFKIHTPSARHSGDDETTRAIAQYQRAAVATSWRPILSSGRAASKDDASNTQL